MEGQAVAERPVAGHFRFALAKFRPARLPSTLVSRPALIERLDAGVGQRLTVVVGSAGAGKSVLLSAWAEARSEVTTWLSCDASDADPVRFWAGFIEAIQMGVPGFGADATELLASGGSTALPDVVASIANDAGKLPVASAVVVDDFHHAEPAVSKDMANLVRFWPGETVQLVLSARIDPSARLHPLRMSGELCELRDHDLRLSLDETRELMANFGVVVSDGDLALLQARSEGWTAALQMAALTLRDTKDPARATSAMGAGGQEIAEYFISEVLDQQPPDVGTFMLETSVLDVLTPEACEAVTGKADAEALLHRIDAGNLFMEPLDEERSSFRCHNLARRLLGAELRARDRLRAEALQLRAAEWFESTGDVRQAARGFLTAKQPSRALSVIQDRLIADFLSCPVPPAPLELGPIDPSFLLESPDRLVLLALDLLLSGEAARGGEYLDLLDTSGRTALFDAKLSARFATARALRFVLAGKLDEALAAALIARDIQTQKQLTDECNVITTAVLLQAYSWLSDVRALEREAADALAAPELPDLARLMLVPGVQALAWYENGELARAANAATAARTAAERLGFTQHVYALDYLRTLAGLALERRDFDTAEKLTDQAVSISERRGSAATFLVLLDRATIWAARGQIREALATIDSARLLLEGTASSLLNRADELEGSLRLSLGDVRSPVEFASHLAEVPRALLLAKVALACRDHQAVQLHLRAQSPSSLGPRHALARQLLLAADAIERDDSMKASLLGTGLQTAYETGFLNVILMTAPVLPSYLIEHSKQLRQDGFMQKLIAAAVEVRAGQPDAVKSGHLPTGHLTPAEMRVLELLPTSNCPQISAILFVSHSTVKTHLRAIYQKLGVATRTEAIARAVDLRLL